MFTRRVGLALLFGALLCATVPVLADSTARIVRLSYLDGDVQIDRGTGIGFERAVLNMPVVQGTQISTRGDGSAEVEFEDGATLRLVPDSIVEFRKLSLRSSGERVSSIELAQGTAYLEATRKKDDFSITAGGPEITLAHDAHFRLRRDGSSMALAVLKGEVDVQGPGGSVRVKKDETLNLNLKDPSQYELAKGIDPDSNYTWNQQRDKYRQTYAANHHEGYNGYNSLYSYGWSDLNYFGSFYPYSGYGNLWRPAGVGLGWDPFADGAWVYYPGSGYMFVSAYPWGWMPYRYGSWMFVPGFGWGWRPGTVWTSWYATPVIYGAPAGYVAPAPPPVTRTGPGTVPGTVAVGAGPVTGVRNARYQEWLKQTSGASAPAHKAGVTPVPAPTAATTAGAPKTSSSSAPTTASPARTTTHTHGNKTPAPKETAPPPASPNGEVSTPPPAYPSDSSGGWGNRSATGAKAPKKVPAPK